MRNTSLTTIDISANTLIRIVVFILAAWFIWFIRDILLVLLVSVLIASALEPLVTRMQRFHIPRAISVLAAYIIFIAFLVLAVTILIPPFVAEIQSLANNLPGIYNQLMIMLSKAGIFVGQVDLLPSLQKGLLDIGQFLTQTTGGIFATTRTVFGSIFSIVLTFVISFYLVISRDSLYTFIRSIVPTEHQPYAINLIKKSQEKIGRWLIAQVVLGVLVSTMAFLGLWLLNVPYALAIVILVFFAEFVPVIGPTISAIPAVLLAFTNSFWLGIVVLVMFLIIHQIEANVLVPNIMRRAVGLNPLMTIIAVLIGAKLAGIIGVLLAVPVATIILLFITDFLPSEKEELAA
jgi:predicted PurR-regulated permease PerM